MTVCRLVSTYLPQIVCCILFKKAVENLESSLISQTCTTPHAVTFTPTLHWSHAHNGSARSTQQV